MAKVNNALSQKMMDAKASSLTAIPGLSEAQLSKKATEARKMKAAKAVKPMRKTGKKK